MRLSAWLRDFGFSRLLLMTILTMLAMSALAMQAARAEPMIRGKSMSQWINSLTNDVDPHEKLYAANALETCGPPCAAALPALHEQLTNNSLPDFASAAIAGAIFKINPAAPEAQTVDFLMRMVNTEYQKNRGIVFSDPIRALAAAGPRAQAAVPRLMQIRQSTSVGSMQYEIDSAVRQIQGGRN